MKKKVLILYYSQTGQLKRILDSVFTHLNEEDINIEYCAIQPKVPYAFPWKSDDFFNAFPETVVGTPAPIQPIDIDGQYDLIVLGWQPWYLSLSQPIAAFLQSADAKRILSNQNILLIAGIRNMWVMAFQDLKDYLFDLNANIIGNIVLEDTNPNLRSVRTVTKWQLGGDKGPYKNLPEAGVSQDDIAKASRFGPPIANAILANSYESLQEHLLRLGAVKENLPIMLVEKNGKKIFKIWSSFILKKGGPDSKGRLGRVRLFKNYLVFIIFVVSPIPALIFRTFGKLFPNKAKATIQSFTTLKKSAE